MSIRFSNGHELTFSCGAGALEFDGCGWPWEWPLRWAGRLRPKEGTVVAKTVALDPIVGNLSLLHPWTCVRPLWRNGKRGAVNAVGLTGPGLPHLIKYHYRTAMKKGYKYAISVKVNNPEEAKKVAELLKPLDLAYVEVNWSCPNIKKIAAGLAPCLEELAHSGQPLMLKVSDEQIEEEFIEAADPFVEAYHGINAVRWDKIFPGETSPIEHYKHGLQGAVSGDFIHPIAVHGCAKLVSLTKKPVQGGGGNKSIETINHFKAAGCTAWSFGTAYMWTPWRPNRVMRQYEDQMKSQTNGNGQ